MEFKSILTLIDFHVQYLVRDEVASKVSLFLSVKTVTHLCLEDEDTIEATIFCESNKNIKYNQQLCEMLEAYDNVCLHNVQVSLKLCQKYKILKTELICRGITAALGTPSQISCMDFQLQFTVQGVLDKFAILQITNGRLRRMLKKQLLQEYYKATVVNIQDFIKQPKRKEIRPLGTQQRILAEKISDFIDIRHLLMVFKKYWPQLVPDSPVEESMVPSVQQTETSPQEIANIPSQRQSPE